MKNNSIWLFYFFLLNLVPNIIMATIVKIKKVSAMGRVKKMDRLPRDMRSDCRIFLSRISPRIKATNMGGRGISNFVKI